MKKKILIIFSVIITMGFQSCANFLDKAPLGELSDASFWKSYEDAYRYTADMYRWLPSEGVVDNDIQSDDVVHGIKWAEGSKATSGLYDPLSEDWDYGLVRKTNLFLEKIDLVPNVTPEQKNSLIAEARFFRGRFYFEMMRSYGDVPYTDKTLGVDELLVSRTPIAEVYAKTVADFQFAIDNLSTTPSQKGRLTKGAALTQLAEMQIYFAGFTKGMGAGLSTYAEAAATSKKIMDLGVYGLWDEGNVKGNYDELFWEGESDNCNEIILAYQHDNSNGMETSMLGWGTFPNVGWGGVDPTQSLVDAFEDSEGALLKDSKIYDPKQPWKNRDPRFEVDILYHGSMLKKWGGPFQTIPASKTKLVDGIERPTGIGACGDATATGYNQKKWVDQTISIDYANGWQGSKDHPIWRFAEVLLWFAEADNEVNGPTEAGLEAINRVRSRVGQPVLQNTNGALPTYVATKEAFRERIRNEYRVEMALEGKRYYAIRRWRDEKGDPIALKVMNEPILGMPYDEKTKTPFVGPNVIIPGRPEMVRFRAHNIFDPIPQKEIDLNKDLKQNPGYE